MTTSFATRVLCVDDHDFIVEGLKRRIDLEQGIECVGHIATADDLVSEVDQNRAQVVLLDIDMPGRDPFEAMADLRRASPDVRVIILTAYVRDQYVDTAFDNGAWGYFSKSDPPEDVIDGIRRVSRGEYAFGRSVMERVEAPGRDGHSTSRQIVSKLQSLTPREREVLAMIGKGMSRADIARVLHRSIKTIDAHHTSIMKKVDIHDRAELAIYAVREGLVQH